MLFEANGSIKTSYLNAGNEILSLTVTDLVKSPNDSVLIDTVDVKLLDTLR